MAEHFVSASCCLPRCASCVKLVDEKVTRPPVALPEMAHLVSSGDGLVVTVDRESGRWRCVCALCWWPGVCECFPLALRLRLPGLQVTYCGVRTTDLLSSGSTCTLATRWDTPPTCRSPWKRCAFSPSPLPTSRQTHTPLWNGATSLWRSKRLLKRNLCKKVNNYLGKSCKKWQVLPTCTGHRLQFWHFVWKLPHRNWFVICVRRER